MNELRLTDEEKKLLLFALEYFKKAEEREIAELSLPGGNKAFIPECQARLQTFKSLISKIEKLKIDQKKS